MYACIDKCACRGSIKGSHESSERGYLRTEVIFKWRIYMTTSDYRERMCNVCTSINSFAVDRGAS